VTGIVSLLLFGVVVYRTLSKDIYKRRNENDKFRTWANKFLSKLGLSIPADLPNLDSRNLSLLLSRWKYNAERRKKYKTVICPGCHKKLYLDRGRGRVVITCKACKTEFKAKV
jgi:hypothetical protein